MKQRLAKKIYYALSPYWRKRMNYFDIVSIGDHRIEKAIRIINKTKNNGKD